MDLLEYQGKQLFARHGLAVSQGKAVTTVQEAVDAAGEVGYPVVVKAQPIDISATIGIALAPADAATADECLSCADLALERARRDKRPLALYQPGLKPALLDQLSLLGELRQAIERDELRLYFQP